MSHETCEEVVPAIIRFLSKSVGADKVSSIIFFGSFLDGGMSPVSDIDVLVVLRGSNKDAVKKAAAALRCLEKPNPSSSLIEVVLEGVKTGTGMFKSFFVCSEESLRLGDFPSIFSLSRGMSLLLAPSKLVLGSVIDGARVVYGDAELPPPPKPDLVQLLKSLAMNLLLSVAAFMVAPLTGEATKYSMEAAKWSSMASYYYTFKRRLPVNRIPQALKGWTRRHAARLLSLRRSYRNDPLMLALTPLFTLAVHILALKGAMRKAL
ncbi:MAG: nucleotidyltransferase domain-containing protein [Candidatus Freyarchaeota archaeon]|nr:nucleotidyltransferase domain-containing protein [Candidatus Jordarchaeia archaeon]